jgi:hypothetical protein
MRISSSFLTTRLIPSSYAVLSIQPTANTPKNKTTAPQKLSTQLPFAPRFFAFSSFSRTYHEEPEIYEVHQNRLESRKMHPCPSFLFVIFVASRYLHMKFAASSMLPDPL